MRCPGFRLVAGNAIEDAGGRDTDFALFQTLLKF